MIRVGREHFFCDFDASAAPVVTVEPGEPVTLEVEVTLPELRRTQQWPNDVDFDTLVHATGPVGVAGAEPSDTLVVEILEVSLHEWGWSAAIEGFGLFGDQVAESEAIIVPIDGATARFENLVLPCNPFPGTIGVAPAGPPVNALWPGVHGGNMDNHELTPGARLFLPVAAHGALFGIADIHGVMGHGEVSGTAIECGADVTVRFDVIKNQPLEGPAVEHPTSISLVASAPTLDEAAQIAAQRGVKLLRDIDGWSERKAMMLLGAVCDLLVLQAVNPLKSCSLRVPKSILRRQDRLRAMGYRYGGSVLA